MTRSQLVARILALSIAGFFCELIWAGGALALNPVVGTVQINGAVWVSGEADNWDTILSTRPMVVGDSFKTGEDGYLLADLGVQGVFGMYGNSRILTLGNGDSPQIDVSAGKVAFHLGASSELTVSVSDAELTALRGSPGSGVDAYVEINENGDAVVSVEYGALNLRMAGTDRRIDMGQRFLLNQAALGVRNEQLAAADEAARQRDKAAGLVTEDDDDDVAGVPVDAAGGTGIGAGEVTIGVLAVGGGVAAFSGGSSGGDSNGSP